MPGWSSLCGAFAAYKVSKLVANGAEDAQRAVTDAIGVSSAKAEEAIVVAAEEIQKPILVKGVAFRIAVVFCVAWVAFRMRRRLELRSIP